MASGPGTGVAAPPAQHVAKMTVNDPALQAAVQRAYATNDQASIQAMAPGLMSALQQAQADQATLIPASFAPALQSLTSALTPQGNIVQLPAAQQQALTQVAQQFAQQPVQQYQNQVARAQVRRVTGDLNPQLEQIRQDLDHRGNQIQATSEHRRIEERKAFQRQVLGRLTAIERAARIQRY